MTMVNRPGQAPLDELLVWLLEQGAVALNDREDEPAAPERQIVEHGVLQTWPMTSGCAEVLAVRWEPFTPKQNTRNPTAQECAVITQVRLVLELRRCVPVPNAAGGPPKAADETAANLQLARDLQAMWRHITRLTSTGDLPAGLSCDRATPIIMEPTPPAGGLAGGRIVVSVTL